MELRGEFTSYDEVLDLLQIITMGKKTGEVNLKNERENLTIVFKDGKVVDFQASSPTLQTLRERVTRGELPLDEAVKFLLHHVAMWEWGKFHFTEGESGSEGIGAADTMNLMMNFTKEEDELPDEVREVLRKNAVFRLSEEAELPITIDEEAWKLLTAVCKRLPIWEAVVASGSSFNEDVKTLKELMEKRLIEPTEEVPTAQEEKKEEEEKPIPPEKMEKVKELIVEAMGPMGEFLIEETLEELGVEQLVPDKVGRFIEVLIDKIPDSCLIEGEKCRDRLREQILGLLKGGSDES